MPNALEDIGKFIFMEEPPQPADLLLIPGGAYPCVGERAAQLYRQGYAPLLLPSGRYSVHDGRFLGAQADAGRYPGPYETEWEFLRDVGQKNGVPSSAFLREDRAVSTWDNARFSRRATDAAGLQVKRAILCCKSLHARRAYLYYQYFYPETQFFVCPVDIEGITRQTWHTTPQGIALVMGEMEKIGRQFGEMYLQRLQGRVYDPDEPSVKDRWAADSEPGPVKKGGPDAI